MFYEMKPASDGRRDFAGNVILRPHCPQHGEMKWDGDHFEYLCEECFAYELSAMKARVEKAVRDYDPHSKVPAFYNPSECAGCDYVVTDKSYLRATTVRDTNGTGTTTFTVWYCEDCRDILQVGELDVVLVEYPHQIRWFR